MTNPRSPFQYMRWEIDEEKIIWLPPELKEWEGKRSVYIIGSRGTGKTTLLKGLEWQQRLHNESVKKQIENPFEKKYIGVYLNMPDFITRHFINWPRKKLNNDDIDSEEENARVYSLYIEYQILQLVIKAIQELRVSNILKFSPEDEQKTINELLSERPELNDFLDNKNNGIYLNDIRLCFKRMHENIRFCAVNKLGLEPQKSYPTLQMGKMLEEVTGILLLLCSKGFEISNDFQYNWTLKVCIDQTESPELYQQKAINTMVARQETGDVSFAIASLDGLDIESTYIPRHPLTDADREFYSLEQVYSKQSKFVELITAVTVLRFQKYLKQENISIDLKKILGNPSINSLLLPILSKSENKSVQEFIDRSKNNIENIYFKMDKKNRHYQSQDEEDIEDNYEDDFKIPPFYETYLYEKLRRELNLVEKDKKKIRLERSQVIRKKMVASMLCLCSEYQLPVPYAGYYMVINMSDQCIRDFLRQMHYIFIEQNFSAEKFIKTKISPTKQNDAIKKTSDSKYDGINNELPYNSDEVKQLVYALGRITHKIQSDFKNKTSLLTPERGFVYIDFSKMKSDLSIKRLSDILKSARDTHTIKVRGEFFNYIENKEILFRLHKLYAPKFEYSYRGAFAQIKINGDDLLTICLEKDPIKIDNLIENVLSTVQKDDKPNNVKTLDNWK